MPPLRGPLRKRQSNLWYREDDDWYIEPAWCSARLFQVEPFEGTIWDPACGAGTIVIEALKRGLPAAGSDLVARGWDSTLTPHDFLMSSHGVDNIVSNPPFKYAQEFTNRGLALARRKLALLLPASWIQGQKRSRWLEATPLRRVWFIAPRPSMPPGQVVVAGGRPGNGTTDYAWFVWERGFNGGPEVRWLRRHD